ncbi:MAG: hypothetical protein P4L66_15395 [Acetobacteraceae bacterium]|nr:hypothetical protein [Acetobacteraceae bacterium]
MIDRRVFLAALLTGSVATIASAHAQPYQPVPELRREPMPPPRPGFLWEPGHWRWDGRAYFWVRGHWIEARPHYHRYIPGHWDRRGPNWFWVEPHWE